MDRDELAEYLKNPYVKVIGGATRGPDPGLSANTTVYGHETDQTHYLPANTATNGVVARPLPQGSEILETPARDTAPRPSKYRNQRTEYNGRMYDSKKEAEFAEGLDLRVKAGELLSWIPQVSFPLTVGRHRIDFVLIEYSGMKGNRWLFATTFWEVKGRDLPMGRRKRQEFEKLYKVKVVLI